MNLLLLWKLSETETKSSSSRFVHRPGTAVPAARSARPQKFLKLSEVRLPEGAGTRDFPATFWKIYLHLGQACPGKQNQAETFQESDVNCPLEAVMRPTITLRLKPSRSLTFKWGKKKKKKVVETSKREQSWFYLSSHAYGYGIAKTRGQKRFPGSQRWFLFRRHSGSTIRRCCISLGDSAPRFGRWLNC